MSRSQGTGGYLVSVASAKRRKHPGRSAGSGKRATPKKSKVVEHSSLPTLELPRPRVAQRVEVGVVPEFPAGDPRNEVAGPEGRRGEYVATAVLCVPGVNSVLESVALQTGDSLLAVPSGLVRVVCPIGEEPDVPRIEVHFFPNKHGRLGHAEMRYIADHFEDARRIAHDVLMPALSRWSFDHDVALQVSLLHISEVSTGTQWIAGVLVGAVQLLSFGEEAVRSTPECRTLLSSYREGLNAENPFLQALSFARVIEGVGRQRQVRVQQLLKEGTTPTPRPSERIPLDIAAEWPGPTDSVVREAMTAYAGQKFTSVMERLRPTIRNAVAHLDPTGEEHTLVADRWEDVRTVLRAVPVLRYMARVLLEDEVRVAQLPS